MAVLSPSRFVQVIDFTAGLERARRAVFRLASHDGRSFSSGWLITDTLAVVPNYALEPADIEYHCAFDVGTRVGPKIALKEVKAKPVDHTTPTVSDPMPVLLRLARRQPRRALILPDQRPQINEQVFILQHPNALPSLQLSIGRLLHVDGDWLFYDASTVGGSSGSPVFDANWNLLGMHHQGQQFDQSTGNSGLVLGAVLRYLRRSKVWPEIAKYHKLADVGAAEIALSQPTATDSPVAREMLRAAVLWGFEPEEFDPVTRDWLQRRVVPPDKRATRWVLQPGERVKLLHSAGSLDALRTARGTTPSQPAPDAGQRAIDCILAGPPFDLAKVPSAELSHWLQAVRWFSAVVPDLPTPATVNRELDHRRVLERLERLVGPTFRGRETELKVLREWDRIGSGPMALFGIGGVGKSALVAKFAHEVLEAGRLVLWLDFDRADLAPDDAVSVLTVLTEQAAIQLDGFTAPTADPNTWELAVRTFGTDLNLRAAGKAILLVLDGFEVAQHFRKHTELWSVLEVLLATAPATRVLVAGRAPVPTFQLASKPATAFEVTGLERSDASAWLREGGIRDGPIQDRVLAVTDRVPLFIRMAIKLAVEGVPPDSLPADLPRVMTEEYLYSRVIDRLVEPAIRPLARGVLVLRRVVLNLLEPVLGDLLPPELTPTEAFDKLCQEWAIVEVTSSPEPELLVRPNVRASALKLLELENVTQVRGVDRRAADWYAGRHPDDPATAAERVYHLLRLGDTAGAEAAWRSGCGARLLFAIDDLPDGSAARAWLRVRLDDSFRFGEGLKAWDAEALERVRDALRRGLDRAVPSILSERTDRIPESPLLVYDAYWKLRSGDLPAARTMLGQTPDIGGIIGRDRALLAALLAARAEDRQAADECLVSIQKEYRWNSRSDRSLIVLAVQAARIRLTVDLAAELKLLSLLHGGADITPIQHILSPLDVMLPDLGRRLGKASGFESIGKRSISIPSSPNKLREFGKTIGSTRDDELPSKTPFDLPPRPSQFNPDDPTTNLTWNLLDELASGVLQSDMRFAMYLRMLGLNRWNLATASLFLSDSCALVQEFNSVSATSTDLLNLAVTATLAAFLGGQPETYTLSYSIKHAQSHSLSKLFNDIIRVLRKTPVPPPPEYRLTMANEFASLASVDGDIIRTWLRRKTSAGDSSVAGLESVTLPLESIDLEGTRPVFLYLLGPDPLELLVQRVLELPDLSSL